jgi:hypothetical protein
MHALRTVVLSLTIASVVPNFIWATPPKLLPDAENFELTFREDSVSALPLGPACGAEAALTLACRAFVVTLQNVGVHTVHLSRIACQEPVVIFERKEPNSSSGWWAISTNSASRHRCTPWVYENVRLRPGETTEYSTRLVSQSRPPEFAPVWPGPYTVRARWVLWGCTENPEGTYCLTPLQVFKANSGGGPPTGEVEWQDPVEVISKEIIVNSPILTGFGPLKLGFKISIASNLETDELRKRLRLSCASDQESSIECTVFHFAIRNLGNRPVRNGRWTCSDFSMIPEYRADGGEWKLLQPRLMACTANMIVETAIQPGEAAEGNFTLSSLAPRFATSPLYPAGKYEIHVRFHSQACFASPDGSFCIQDPKEQIETISNTVTLNTSAFVPDGE